MNAKEICKALNAHLIYGDFEKQPTLLLVKLMKKTCYLSGCQIFTQSESRTSRPYTKLST